MRLLIDEMYPPAIAEQLRKAGQAVRALCAFCETHQGADAASGAVYWLQPPG